jgi:hypothetical protein
MPRPPTPHAATRKPTGTGPSASAVSAMPTASTAKPRRTSQRGPRATTTRCCTHAPVVHASVALVRARPATQVGAWWASVAASDT